MIFTFHKKGFTLIELMISVGIFTVMTALFLFRADRFDGSIVLTNLAYDIALTIREAQSYGLNVSRASDGNFVYAYGVHLETANPTQFILFVDVDSNGAYSGTTAELVKRYRIGRGNRISGLCTGADLNSCVTTSPLDIRFLRPNPVALITGSSNYSRITLLGRDGVSTKSVVVRKTGQISVE